VKREASKNDTGGSPRRKAMNLKGLTKGDAENGVWKGVRDGEDPCRAVTAL